MGISRTSYQPTVLKLNFIGGRVWLGNEIRPKVVNGSVCKREVHLTGREI
jgi:hypothetical protein